MANVKHTNTSYKKKKHRTRRAVYFILAAILVFVLLRYLITRPSGETSIAENGVGTVFTPVQNVFSYVTDVIGSWFGTSSDSDSLQAELDELRMENERLKIELNAYAEVEAANTRLQVLLDTKTDYETLDPICAKVIAKDTGKWFETFTLNRGTNDAVSVNMAVVNGSGLIGRVESVGLNYCTVMSIIDTRSSIAALIGRSRDNGMIQGYTKADDGEIECRMYYIANLGNIKVGDSVYTSGLDSRFPKGIYIGDVTAISRSGDTADKYVSVRPAVDFSSIEEVFILREEIYPQDDAVPSALPAVPTATPQPIVTPKPTATTSIYAYATAQAVDDNAVYQYPTATPDPNATPAPTPTPKPTKPVPEAAWLND